MEGSTTTKVKSTISFRVDNLEPESVHSREMALC